jgi:hypothetical protein
LLCFLAHGLQGLQGLLCFLEQGLQGLACFIAQGLQGFPATICSLVCSAQLFELNKNKNSVAKHIPKIRLFIFPLL